MSSFPIHRDVNALNGSMCPRCGSPNTECLGETLTSVFFQCLGCRHVWLLHEHDPASRMARQDAFAPGYASAGGRVARA